jgi:Metallo-beta-lactamase superfamily
LKNEQPPARVSLYFPHAGKGQSVLVRFPGNRWVVIDANHAADGMSPAAVELLRGPAEEPGFEILAVVLTHLHTDHYSGILELLEFCAQLAGRRGGKLGDVVKNLILPKSYDLFLQYLKDVRRAYLKSFLTRLESLSEEGVRIEALRHYDFAWRSHASGDLRSDESWLVTYYPPSTEVNRWLFEGRVPELQPPVKLGSSLVTEDNRFVYVLGVGHGPASSDLHVLLTSDIPGETFSELTRGLRQSVLPGIQARKIGAPYSLGLLIRQASGTEVDDRADAGARLRPIQCLTVPHHGSGDCAMAEDLEWWLDDDDQEVERPAFAMVQGGPRAMKRKTLEELFKAIAGFCHLETAVSC